MYSEDISTVTDALKNSSTEVFSDETISRILQLTTSTNDSRVTFTDSTPDSNGNVTVAAGAEVVLVNSSDSVQTTITPPVNAPVVIFQGKGGVIATFNDGLATVASGDGIPDRVVVGSAGNDHIVISDSLDTQITLGTGNSTVVTGGGNDTVFAGLGNSTITGGSSDAAVVRLGGSASNYTITTQNGHAVVTHNSSNITTDITRIQYVQLDNGNALVFAKDSVEAAVSILYHTAFGRDADAGGLNFWFDVARAGGTLKQISDGFVRSAEYRPLSSLSDHDFVNGLYNNTFNRDGEDLGIQYWVDALAHGSTRADLICSFSQIAAQTIDGTAQHVEAQIVGSVTIVQGII